MEVEALARALPDGIGPTCQITRSGFAAITSASNRCSSLGASVPPMPSLTTVILAFE